MRLLVLGAKGMLGNDVMVAAEGLGHEVTGYGHAELDITDIEAMRRRFLRDRPDAIINCAAWTDVDGAEDDVDGALLVNGTAAGYAATAAAEAGARILYVSSDYVFDGLKTSPYVESDQVGPVSSYGSSKLAGEQATMLANRRSWIVRSSWLFGLNGGNFVDTMLRLGADHGEVLVVRDQIGSPTWTWHLAHGLVRLVDTDAFGIHHMAAGETCSWYDFAVEIFKLSGMDVKTLSATTDMLARKATRPPYSVMVSENENAIRLPSWHDGLAGYLEQRKSAEEASS